jgi:alkylation response protein AidB-like acyl-CoA dehydrogenase
VPRWPAELGGRDAGPIEQMVYLEEMSRRRVPRTVNPQGLEACAPTLADHGAGVQRDSWLPATLHGEMSWCVAVDGAAAADDGGGSGAAQDPAAAAATLPLLVERSGALVLTGAVAAPPGAADADRCLCAVSWLRPRSRDGETDVAVVAVDLGAAGVARPPSAGNEPGGDDARLGFGDVAVSPDDVIGGRDQGWPVLQSVRARLRSVRWITSLLAVHRALDALVDVGRARGLTDDAVFRDTLAGLQVEADAVRALAYRALAKQGTGRPNPELAMLPLATAEAERRLYLVGLETLGADGLDLGLDGPMGWPSGSWASEWLAAAKDTSEAGGLAAERDRVAARVLGFPLR